MYRYITVVLFLAFAFQQSYGTNVTVKGKDGKTCLYAELMVNFSVSYQQDNNTNLSSFVLPTDVTTNGSFCSANNSVLKINFGKGHSWSMSFQNKGQTYQAESIVFVYNLSDSVFFPHSKLNGTANVTVHPNITDVGLDTFYSCMSEETLAAVSVNQTLWNVLIQAFVSNGTLGKNHTVCVADQSKTTVSPTTHPITTPVPTTTPTPTPTLPTPTTGNYTISVNSSACLLANFGLRIGVKLGDKYEEANLDPNATSASGSCGVSSSQLVLVSDTMNVTFTFTNDTKKFRLHGFSVTGKTGSGMPFAGVNNNLSLWEASLSSSYMCNKEQNYSINSNLSLFTFNLRVQPFGVSKNQFSTAEDCQADGTDSYIVPIAVGIALLVLILIVVLAYFIGRKRNMAAAEECFLDTDLSFLVPIAVGVALSFLIILVLISYLIGRRKSRTGYQSV